MTPRHRGFARSLGHAWAGAVYVWRTQGNMRIHLGAGLGVLALARWLALPRAEALLALLTVGLVVAVEALNTAVECAVDLAADGPHPVARRAKDVAAAAVLWTAAVAVLAGIGLFGAHLGSIPEAVARRWAAAPAEVGLVALASAGLVLSGLRR